MYQAYRDDPGAAPHPSSDLTDYYDNMPPPHRMSSGPIQYNNLPNDSTANIPMSERGAPGGGNEPFFPNHANDTAYTPNNAWRDNTYSSGGSSKKKWFILGGVVVVLAVVGVVVGVLVSKHKSSSSSSSSSLSSGNSSSVTNSNPNDPSQFTKNPALVNSFYGIAYTPAGSQLPECGNDLQDIITDIQLMSQLTTRVRLYGADCNQSALVLEAIKQTKVDVKVFLGNYPDATDNGTAYLRQRDEIVSAIQTYGTDNILGVTVGNEFILDYLADNGGADDPNGAIAAPGAQMLLGFIQDTISNFSSLGINLPVGNAEAGSYFNNDVLAAVDYGMSNVHPWFGNVSIDDAAGWTWEFFETNNVQPAAAINSSLVMYIAETGWPTGSTTESAESDGPSNASVANLQIFLDTFVCAANANNTQYFFFEYFDEEWKNVTYGGVEGYWGLFDQNRNLKNVTIPTCS